LSIAIRRVPEQASNESAVVGSASTKRRRRHDGVALDIFVVALYLLAIVSVAVIDVTCGW